MSDAAVPPNKMDGPDNLDDASIEALFAGAGHDVDPSLADVLGDMRVAYTSLSPTVGAELAALIRPTATASWSPRGARTRSVIAKIGAATAALVAATSGLAVAGALPAPVQSVLSHIGIGGPSNGTSPDHHADITANSADTTTTISTALTTVLDNPTPTTDAVRHGTEVSGVAHEHTNHGCEHGHDVANFASDARSNGQPCHDTSTTNAAHTTHTSPGHNPTNDNTSGNVHTSPTTAPDSPSGGEHGGHSNSSRNGN
jgi:hypothetical protein